MVRYATTRDLAEPYKFNRAKVLWQFYRSRWWTVFDPYPSVIVIYESPRMLVLFGNLQDNADLWEAADFLQNEHRFDLTDIIKEGEGSKGDPGRVYLIMEKSSGVRG